MDPTLEELEREFGPLTPAERAAVRNLPKGSAYGWPQVIATAESDGTALANSTSATSILPTNALGTIPAGTLKVGSMLWLRAAGRISNIVTTPGTLTLDVRFGSVTAFASSAMQLNAVAKTNVTWMFDLMMRVSSVGNGTVAKVLGIGTFLSESVVGSAVPGTGGSGTLQAPASAPADGTGFDSTVAQLVDFRGTFSIANAGNSIQLHQYVLSHLTAQ